MIRVHIVDEWLTVCVDHYVPIDVDQAFGSRAIGPIRISPKREQQTAAMARMLEEGQGNSTLAAPMPENPQHQRIGTVVAVIRLQHLFYLRDNQSLGTVFTRGAWLAVLPVAADPFFF